MGRHSEYGLTDRELEILGLICDGLDNPEIAAKLFLDVKTVEHHSNSIRRKLDATSTRKLIHIAYEHGLALPPPPISHYKELLYRAEEAVRALNDIVGAMEDAARVCNRRCTLGQDTTGRTLPQSP